MLLIKLTHHPKLEDKTWKRIQVADLVGSYINEVEFEALFLYDIVGTAVVFEAGTA